MYLSFGGLRELTVVGVSDELLECLATPFALRVARTWKIEWEKKNGSAPVLRWITNTSREGIFEEIAEEIDGDGCVLKLVFRLGNLKEQELDHYTMGRRI